MNDKTIPPNAQTCVDLVTRLFRALVRHENLLEVHYVGSSISGFIQVRASADDTPRIIGKAGAHFKAVSAIVGAGVFRSGIAMSIRPILKPVHPGDGTRLPKFEPNRQWPRDAVRQLVLDAAQWAFGPESGVALIENQDGISATISVQVPASVPDAVATSLATHFAELFTSIGLTNGVILCLALQR